MRSAVVGPMGSVVELQVTSDFGLESFVLRARCHI